MHLSGDRGRGRSGLLVALLAALIAIPLVSAQRSTRYVLGPYGSARADASAVSNEFTCTDSLPVTRMTVYADPDAGVTALGVACSDGRASPVYRQGSALRGTATNFTLPADSAAVFGNLAVRQAEKRVAQLGFGSAFAGWGGGDLVLDPKNVTLNYAIEQGNCTFTGISVMAGEFIDSLLLMLNCQNSVASLLPPNDPSIVAFVPSLNGGGGGGGNPEPTAAPTATSAPDAGSGGSNTVSNASTIGIIVVVAVGAVALVAVVGGILLHRRSSRLRARRERDRHHPAKPQYDTRNNGGGRNSGNDDDLYLPSVSANEAYIPAPPPAGFFEPAVPASVAAGLRRASAQALSAVGQVPMSQPGTERYTTADRAGTNYSSAASADRYATADRANNYSSSTSADRYTSADRTNNYSSTASADRYRSTDRTNYPSTSAADRYTSLNRSTNADSSTHSDTVYIPAAPTRPATLTTPIQPSSITTQRRATPTDYPGFPVPHTSLNRNTSARSHGSATTSSSRGAAPRPLSTIREDGFDASGSSMPRSPSHAQMQHVYRSGPGSQGRRGSDSTSIIEIGGGPTPSTSDARLPPTVTSITVSGPRLASTAFTSAQSDEADLVVGDVLVVHAVYSDGWAYVTNQSNEGVRGLVPITCIDAEVADVELVQMQQAMVMKGVLRAVQFGSISRRGAGAGAGGGMAAIEDA
ncbi:hypothetical protein H9P43_007352 [Blastocladiella emersonii ATCC 22665]|nr:hypothetical protein H9P43_007352 [Blastocladiella emersonii ATCC 22665]